VCRWPGVLFDHPCDLTQNPLRQQPSTPTVCKKGAVQSGKFLQEAFSELQNTLEELQGMQEELALTRQIVETECQRYQKLFNLVMDGYWQLARMEHPKGQLH